ncbi:MAG: phosphoribosylformylglycinamidine synthase subunit PurL [Chloroflexota bacterium]
MTTPDDPMSAEAPIYRFMVRPRQPNDPRSAGLLADARALGLSGIEQLVCNDLYFIEGTLRLGELQRLADELLSDPISQTVEWGRVFFDDQADHPASPVAEEHLVEVALRPGVTDPVAAQIVRGAHLLGLAGVQRAGTGMQYLIQGAGLTEDDLVVLARRLLVNNVIQRFALGQIEPVFPHDAQASGHVEDLPLRDLDQAGLLQLSNQRRAALDLAEMQAIQAYYRAEGREPTDVEFETIAQTWSEHCVHKTFRARIEVRGPDGQVEVDNLLKTYIRAATEQIDAPWVRSAFVDNAGIIDFDDQFEVSFKVETHNHPSAIEPFGGANTGVGGVIRDVLGVSAQPIAATDVLCFGPPDQALGSLPQGVLHPRRIRSGVVAGVQDYGNKMGIPTVNGAILYDPGFTANPLVFCGCVGLAPTGSHPRTPQPGDRVIVIGGRTGRDGLRGATFSSMTMDGQTGEVSGASVQIGDPITEKGVLEVVRRGRDLGLYHAITDCGAGGLSSAVGEMSSACGADVDLQHVRLKYPGLAPWEIWLSEAQERMVLAVPSQVLERLQAICEIFDVELTDIGAFSANRRLVVRYAGRVVLDLDNQFLHHGLPQRRLTAVLPVPKADSLSTVPLSTTCVETILFELLAHPDIASKASAVYLYDHEVQGGTLIKPLTGAANDGPADACVLKPLGTTGWRGLVLSNGINPQFGKVDSYRMALSVIDEAVRNAVAVGADPGRIALLDNFCWGDPLRPETLGSLVQAARGCYDAAVYFGAPFISGKDSFNNEYSGVDGQRHAIPPTLLISAISVMSDVRQAVSMDLKAPGNLLYLVGAHRPELGGSHLAMLGYASGEDQPIPGLAQETRRVYQALHQAVQARLVRACHDLSEGGLAVAAAEMCIGGRLGLELRIPDIDPLRLLFGESNGCLLAEVRPAEQDAFTALFAGLPIQCLGQTTHIPHLQISTSQAPLLSVSLAHLLNAWLPLS